MADDKNTEVQDVQEPEQIEGFVYEDGPQEPVQEERTWSQDAEIDADDTETVDADPVEDEAPAPEPQVAKQTHEFDKARQQDQIARANAERRLEQNQQQILNLQAQLTQVLTQKEQAKEQADDEEIIDDYDSAIKTLRNQLKNTNRQLTESRAEYDQTMSEIVKAVQIERLQTRVSAENLACTKHLQTMTTQFGEQYAQPAIELAKEMAEKDGYSLSAEDRYSDKFPPLRVQKQLLELAFLKVERDANKAKKSAAPAPKIRQDDGRGGRPRPPVAVQGTPEEVISRLIAKAKRDGSYTNPYS